MKTATDTKKDVVKTRKKSTEQKRVNETTPVNPIDTSDNALVKLLNRLKTTVDPNEIRQLSDQIERVVFHKQFINA